MDNGDERIFSLWETQHLFSDNWKHPSGHATNLQFPSTHGEQRDFNATYISPLPSPTSSEGFTVTEGPLPYGNMYNTPRTVDLSMAADPGLLCLPFWPQSGISADMIRQKRTPLPHMQTQCQMPPRFHCGWSRDYEPSSAFPSIPSSSQARAHSYANTAHYDAYLAHIAGNAGNTQDTSCPLPDWDTASNFFHALDDYPFTACSEPQPSLVAPHNPTPPVPSAVLPGSGQICRPSRQARTFRCQWLVMEGSSCEQIVSADRHSVIDHLQRDHGIKPGEEKARQTCLWEGCTKVLNKESLARHILTVHHKEKVHCTECGLLFAREDSLKRHLKGSQHKLSSDMTGGPLSRRNRSGSR